VRGIKPRLSSGLSTVAHLAFGIAGGYSVIDQPQWASLKTLTTVAGAVTLTLGTTKFFSERRPRIAGHPPGADDLVQRSRMRTHNAFLAMVLGGCLIRHGASPSSATEVALGAIWCATGTLGVCNGIQRIWIGIKGARARGGQVHRALVAQG